MNDEKHILTREKKILLLQAIERGYITDSEIMQICPIVDFTEIIENITKDIEDGDE